MEIRRFLALFLLMPLFLYAQEVENNFQQRYSTSVRFKADKKLKLILTPELRTENNSSSFKEYLFEGAFEYELSKWFGLGGLYRLHHKESGDFRRYGLSASVVKSFGNLSASGRLLYTNEKEVGEPDEAEKMLRYQFKLRYQMKALKMTPFAAYESYRDVVEGEWYKSRYLFGVQYRLNKRYRIKLQYKFDYFLQKFQNDHILDLGLKINL